MPISIATQKGPLLFICLAPSPENQPVPFLLSLSYRIHEASLANVQFSSHLRPNPTSILPLSIPALATWLLRWGDMSELCLCLPHALVIGNEWTLSNLTLKKHPQIEFSWGRGFHKLLKVIHSILLIKSRQEFTDKFP